MIYGTFYRRSDVVRPAWFPSNTYCWINCSSKWDILTFHSPSSCCLYRRTTCDIPHSLQPTTTRLSKSLKRQQHFLTDLTEAWSVMHRQQEANLLSRQLIFHLSQPLILSSRSHVYIQSPRPFIFSVHPPAAFRETAVSFLLVILVFIKRTVCNWSRCEKPLFLQAGSKAFNTTSTWQRKRTQQAENEALCMKAQARRSFMLKPLKRGDSHCSLIQRRGEGMKSVSVCENERVREIKWKLCNTQRQLWWKP